MTSFDQTRSRFQNFTQESLTSIETRISAQRTGSTRNGVSLPLTPDEDLEDGAILGTSIFENLGPDRIGVPLEDIDEFYYNQKTFIVVNTRKRIHRFNADNSLFCLSPFNIIRKGAISALTNTVFSYIIIALILLNCILMSFSGLEILQNINIYFVAIFTIEAIIRILARGFVFGQFSYLRNFWDTFDFLILLFECLSFVIHLGVGPFLILRCFRALRMLDMFPSLNLNVNAFFKSIKNLREPAVFIFICLSFFAVFGLQVYMGLLTARCVYITPEQKEKLEAIEDHALYEIYIRNITHQFLSNAEYEGDVCRMGYGVCPNNFTCVHGFAPNPNYGYTSYDNFGLSLLSTFRLMTQDYWENLYEMILITAGSWHIIYFMQLIFIGTFWFMNLITTIVIVTYMNLRKKTQPKSKELKSEAINNDCIPENTDEFQEITVLNKENGQEKQNSNSNGIYMQQCHRCVDLFCAWNCCSSVQKLCSAIVFQPFVQLFILVCLVLHTVLMCLDQHNMEISIYMFLHHGSLIFICIFSLEAAFKIIALSPKYYFQSLWNIFEFIVTFATLIGVLSETTYLLPFRVLITLRILRFFKPSNLGFVIFKRTIKPFLLSVLILTSIVIMFSILGRELYGLDYEEKKNRFYDGEVPRWNFVDFPHSAMLVFRALCGEWIESMWDCIVVTGWSCILFFIAVVVIARFVGANLFLAVLLPAFDDMMEPPPKPDEVTNAICIAIRQICHVKSLLLEKINCFSNSSYTTELRPKISTGSFGDCSENAGILKNSSMKRNDSEMEENTSNNVKESNDLTENDVFMSTYPPDCCPTFLNEKLTCGSEAAFWDSWKSLRIMACQFTQSRFLEYFLIVTILISSLTLFMEDIHLQFRPALKNVLGIFDRIFVAIFVLEMIVKLLGSGVKNYFTNLWLVLEFVVVMTSGINMFVRIPFFKAMRILRLWSLIHISSCLQGVKSMVNMVWECMSKAWKVVPFSFLLWIVFVIMGVQLFGGAFYECLDADFNRINASHVGVRDECVGSNHTWIKKSINFDDTLNSFMALFQVATFKGWIDILHFAMDARGVDTQPVKENNLNMFIYFVIFTIICTFFAINLIIGAVIHCYLQQHKKMESSNMAKMNENQKKYYNTIKAIKESKPLRSVPRPSGKFQGTVYDVVTGIKFESFIAIVIILNIVFCGIDHYSMASDSIIYLTWAHIIVVLIFFFEAILKLIGLRYHYFKSGRNVYDFIVVVTSVLGFFHFMLERYFISPTLLQMIRIFEVLRFLPRIKKANGISSLISILSHSLSALNKLCFIFFIIMNIYAVFGMCFFMHVKHGYGLTSDFSFETYGSSMILLFQISTAAGWDGLLFALIEDADCDLGDATAGRPGTCGHPTLAVIFLVSYIIITYFFIFNVMLAAMLNSYLLIKSQEETLAQVDMKLFYLKWQSFDPSGTGFIPVSKLDELLKKVLPSLDPTACLKSESCSMELNLYEGDVINCRDVIAACIKNKFKRQGITVDDTEEIQALLASDKTGPIRTGTTIHNGMDCTPCGEV